MDKPEYSKFPDTKKPFLYVDDDGGLIFPGSFFKWITPEDRKREDEYIEKLLKE